MEDGKVDSLGAEPASVFRVFWRRSPRNKHKKPRKLNRRTSGPVVIILAILAITGTPYYLSRHSSTPAADPAGHPVVDASPSPLSGSASFGAEQGSAPAPWARFAPHDRQPSSGIRALPSPVPLSPVPLSPGPPDSGHARQLTPPLVRSPFTAPSGTPWPTLRPAARPAAEPAVTAATPAATTAATSAARSSKPATETAAAAVINITSTTLGAVGAAAAIVGI
jgi:hypothetical protein